MKKGSVILAITDYSWWRIGKEYEVIEVDESPVFNVMVIDDDGEEFWVSEKGYRIIEE